MVHHNKHCNFTGKNLKLKLHNYGRYKVLAKINDNEYVVDIPFVWSIIWTFNTANLTEYYLEQKESKVLDTLK